MKQVLLLLIRAYQLVLSPWIGRSCRFYPSCSHYAQEAIDIHGAARGSYLTVQRLGRCHPWHEGGIDLVPPSPATNQSNGHTVCHSSGSSSCQHLD